MGVDLKGTGSRSIHILVSTTLRARGIPAFVRNNRGPLQAPQAISGYAQRTSTLKDTDANMTSQETAEIVLQHKNIFTSPHTDLEHSVIHFRVLLGNANKGDRVLDLCTSPDRQMR